MGKLTYVLQIWRFLKSVSALLIETRFAEGKAMVSEDKVMRIRVFCSYAVPETK